MNKVLHGDCLDKLKELEDNSVDSIVTDPPYELGFMGKSWDSTGIANNVEMWKECLRVLKPGGHLLAFSGTRTYHRMACAIEDAGFEVRDMIEWVYGSGFPKSLNIGKAVKAYQETGGSSPRNLRKARMGEEYKPTGQEDYRKGRMFSSDIENDNTKEEINNEWEGWGTALKPAHEPICMARKPLAEKTVAENVLKYGTGGINIDESRVSTEEEIGRDNRNIKNSPLAPKDGWNENSMKGLDTRGQFTGRFPANLIHDNSDEVRECFPSPSPASTQVRKETDDKNGQLWNLKRKSGIKQSFNDSGNASRFFKSIITDKLCTLCCFPFDIKHDTMSVCKNTNVNNAEKSLKTTQATIESTALKNATGQVNKNLVQNVRSVGNLCDLCGTSIAQRLVAIMQDQSQESTLGGLSMPEHKKQILEKCLVSFVDLRGNTDTIPTMENLSLLFGYVSNAIEEYTQKCEVIKSEGQNQWKSLVYRSKASKSERTAQGTITNSHPTIKPIALMEYLIKMVTPKGGIVLDPFAGSGSTLVAAKQNEFQYVGIEMTEEYIKIIDARLASVI